MTSRLTNRSTLIDNRSTQPECGYAYRTHLLFSRSSITTETQTFTRVSARNSVVWINAPLNLNHEEGYHTDSVVAMLSMCGELGTADAPSGPSSEARGFELTWDTSSNPMLHVKFPIIVTEKISVEHTTLQWSPQITQVVVQWVFCSVGKIFLRCHLSRGTHHPGGWKPVYWTSEPLVVIVAE